MAGYIDFSESVNAAEARERGCLPASHWTKRLRRFRRFKGCQAQDIKAACGCGDEWHHVSKKYNRVDFYSPIQILEHRREIADAIATRKQRAEWIKRADAEGVTQIWTRDGYLWYDLPKRRNGKLDPKRMSDIDFERLQSQLTLGFADPTI